VVAFIPNRRRHADAGTNWTKNGSQNRLHGLEKEKGLQRFRVQPFEFFGGA
jgi:hypothetical protein